MEISNFKPEFKNQLVNLQRSQWGEGSDTDEVTNNLDRYEIKIIIDNNQLFGAAVWHINNAVCFIDFIILKTEIQHIGWGRKLMNEVIKSSIDNNCKIIEGEAIDVCGKIYSKNLLESTGFVEQYEIKNYWGNRYPDFDCKECKHRPCICSMHKYAKYINLKE